MFPRPFSMDAQNRAQDLAAVILSASSPTAVAAASSATASFLRRHSSDQSRAFFSAAFPTLIRRLFGFEDPPNPSWLALAADDPALASNLLDLLSPSGPLLSAIFAVDRHSLIKYVFPVERLPEWMRFALQSDRHVPILLDLCSLFKSRVRQDNIQGFYQLQLNVFEYYVFWFAYYPVCRGNSENQDGTNETKPRRSRLENWTSSLPGLGSGSRGSGKKTEGNLYLQLLSSYLCAFVPKCGVGSCQPYRSSLLHYSSSCDTSAFLQSEFFVNTLIHFWMVDNDFSPLSVSVCRSFGISFPFRPVLGEMPPTSGLGEVLNLVVKYLNSCSVTLMETEEKMGIGGSPSLKSLGSCDSSVGSWTSTMQRPLYRFILRTFLFCPMGTSIKNVTQVCILWDTYMTPWRSSYEDFLEFETPVSRTAKSSIKVNGQSQGISSGQAMYTSVWQGYVLSNYLFYCSLAVHFLGFAHKFLHANVDSVIQLVLNVLDILTSSKELTTLLRKVDAAYHSKPVAPSSLSVYKYIPSIREQLQDWEDGLCESDADGSSLHENLNHDLRLFSDSEDGAQNLLQLFVLRAEHEIQGISGDVSKALQALNSIGAKMNILFGDHIKKPHSPGAPEEVHDLHGHGEAFTPKHPGVGKRRWADVNYKGDWMKRPISDSELAWLARLLIRLSDWLNDTLGLDQAEESGSADAASVEVTRSETITIRGPKDAFHLVLAFVTSCFLVFGQRLLRFMKAHRMRINLRFLASKKIVMILLIYAVVSAVTKAFRQAFAAAL